jgi:deoxyadenosine/deoxycytidine kinase
VSSLEERISQRGRDYEKKIETEYLQRLNALYEAWISDFTLCPVLTVPTDDLNYVVHDSHLNLIVSKIREKLAGKEEVLFESAEVAKANKDLG